MLHSRPYKEQSVLAEFLVEGEGRLPMVVRGVRKPKTRQAALLQPFNHLLISWKGRGEVKTVVSMELLSSHRLVGTALYCGFYINELMLRSMVQGYEMEGAPALYQALVTHLAQGQQPIEPLLRHFELDLLTLSGYLPVLDEEASGKPLEQGGVYRFDPQEGVLPLLQPLTPALKPHCFTADALWALSQRDFSRPEWYADFKRFTRLALKPLVGHKPLHSRTLFQPKRRLLK